MLFEKLSSRFSFILLIKYDNDRRIRPHLHFGELKKGWGGGMLGSSYSKE